MAGGPPSVLGWWWGAVGSGLDGKNGLFLLGLFSAAFSSEQEPWFLTWRSSWAGSEWHVCLSDGLDIYTSHADKCTLLTVFWLSRPQTCQCALLPHTPRHAVRLELSGALFPFFFSLKNKKLKKKKKKINQKNKTQLSSPNQHLAHLPFHTASGTVRRAIIRLSHLGNAAAF